MNANWPISKIRRRRSRGDTMLEFAFFVLPTFAIVCGFVDLGMVLFTWNTMQNAVREGARYAVTYQTDGSGHQTTSIKNVVASWSMNFVSASATSGSGGPYIDVNYYSQPTTANPNGTLVTGALANASGNLVEVAVKNYPYVFMAPFSGSFAGAFYANPGSKLAISVYSTDVLGGTPSSGAPAP
jgi:Flp pilus assembly protein TadG